MKKEKSVKPEDKKAALYIRVSTHWQIDKDSLPLQRDDLKNYAKYALGIENTETFEDAGYSGKNTQRPAFQQMMARIRAGEFTHLIVWKIDRISRNLLDFAAMYQELKNLGITFVSKNEQFDTSTAIGEAMLKIILVFAELERNMTAERVTAVMLSRANKGLWNGGKIPYGYDYDPATKEISINEVEGAIVKRIFNRYEDLRSLSSLTHELNAQNVRTKNGNAWSPVTVNLLLQNPFYTGTFRYNYRKENNNGSREYNPPQEWISIEDHHPAIISKEQWENCERILKSNQRGAGAKSYHSKNVHVFAGLLTCGYCQGNMAATLGTMRKSGWRPSLYSCYKKRVTNTCPNKYISDTVLGPFTFNLVANIIRAQRSFGVTTSLEVFERKILRGDVFKDVAYIEPAGLKELYQCIKHSRQSPSDLWVKSIGSVHSYSEPYSEREQLLDQMRANERALERLKDIYLYGSEEYSKKDFIIERKKILNTLEDLEARLNELENAEDASKISDEDFIQRASYFIVSQEMMHKRYINYEKLSKRVNIQILRNFIQNIVKNFCIKDGKIQQIEFKNGITLSFCYN